MINKGLSTQGGNRTLLFHKLLYSPKLLHLLNKIN